jgi:hypothetical protein
MGKTIELAVNEETLRQLRKVADEKGNTIEVLAEKVLRQFLRQEAQQKMQREVDAFRAMHANLLSQYSNQYVAIYQAQVIDHDPDQLALFLRVDEQYPNEPVLIRQVRPEVETVYTIRSPRFVRD